MIRNPDVASEIRLTCEKIKNGEVDIPNGMTEKETVINESAKNIASMYQGKFDSNAINMYSSGYMERDKKFNEIMAGMYKETMLGKDRDAIFTDKNFEYLGYNFNKDGSFVRES